MSATRLDLAIRLFGRYERISPSGYHYFPDVGLLYNAATAEVAYDKTTVYFDDFVHEMTARRERNGGGDRYTIIAEIKNGPAIDPPNLQNKPATRAAEVRADPDPAPDEAADDAPDRPVFPEPWRNHLEICIDAWFRHCDPEGVVNLRSFYQNDANRAFRYKTCISLKDGLKPLIEAAVNEARRAANNLEPISFCPPVATFKAEAGWQARQEDLFEGPVLSIELDENPRAALARLERLLGAATLVVRSGGQWVKTETNEVEDKLHAYWRLKEPARGKEQLAKLKLLRRLAHMLVGGDPSNVPINHPIRWPGSWHRKSTPRLCEIISSTDQLDNEIDLDVALAALEDVAPQSHEEFGFTQKSDGSNDDEDPGRFQVPEGFEDVPLEDLRGEPYPKTADPKLIAAALAVVPNSMRVRVLRGQQITGSEDDPLDWEGWNYICMAAWNGTSGSKEGFYALLPWSRKWPKYIAGTEEEKKRFDRNTVNKWNALFTSPPKDLGAGTIFFLADKAAPGWREEYEARESNGGNTTNGIPGFNLNGGQQNGGQSARGNNPPLIVKLGSKAWGPVTFFDGKEYRFGADQSKVIDPRRGTWFDFEANEGGNIRDLMKKVEARASSEQAPDGGWQFHDQTPAAPTSWLIKKLLPEIGAGLVAGQWGTFKTTCALDLSVSVTAGVPFAGRFIVKRQGGVAYFAVEGGGGLKSRFNAVAHERGITSTLPFTWRPDCPPLTASNALDQLTHMAKEVAKEFKQKFNVELVLIFIDTMVAAAAYANAGDDNDVAITQKVMSVLSKLSQRTGALVLGIDHFGKIVDTGTRGSSSKEGHAEVVLVTLGDRQLNGAVTNTRLAIRKQREGISGLEIPFTPRDLVIGTDPDGDEITRKVLDWNKQAAPRTPDDAGWSKSLHLLRRILMTILADAGRNVTPFADGAPVRAVDLELVRAEFYKQYPADGNEKQKAEIRRKAFTRTTKNAQDKELIMIREINGTQFIWLVNPVI